MKTAKEFEILRRAIESPCPYCDDGLTDQDCTCPEYMPKLQQFATEAVEVLVLREKQVEALVVTVKPLLDIQERLMAAIWDSHYGKGIHEDYANAVQRDLVEAQYRIRAILAAIEVKP